MKKIWSAEARRYLYQRVKGEFGPCSNWASRSNPVGNGDKTYLNLMPKLERELQVIFGMKVKSPMAIKQQLDWAVHPSQDLNTLDAVRIKQYVMCRSAALEVGLIEPKDMVRQH